LLPPPPRMRIRPSLSQTEELRKAYIIDPHPTKEQREELGKRIGMCVGLLYIILSVCLSTYSIFGHPILRRYQSVTNWFQNQRSLAKKRLDDDVAFDKTSHPYSNGSPTADRSTDTVSYSRDSRGSPAFETPGFPPRSSHPSVSALIRRDKRSPSVERSSSRGSPYHCIIPPHRPRRTRPEPHQLEALQKLYRRTSNPSIEERNALALEVGMYVLFPLIS
jgi:hypothetical protein